MEAQRGAGSGVDGGKSTLACRFTTNFRYWNGVAFPKPAGAPLVSSDVSCLWPFFFVLGWVPSGTRLHI